VSLVGVVLLLLLALIAGFTASNLATVTLMFWRWPLMVAPLAFVVVGAGVFGALVVLCISWLRHRHLHGRIRELESRVRVLEAAPREVPYGTRSEDTRRLS
jgi:uncharacterized integral membrane protein